MIRSAQIFLWGIVAELEYQLYPWKSNTPPNWAVKRYNLPDGSHEEEYQYDEKLNFEWLKHHEDKIAKLQLEMIYITEEVRKLKDVNQTED